MSDRSRGVIVIFNDTYRMDDLDETLTIIRNLRAVADVKPLVADADHYLAKEAAKLELREKVMELFR